MTEIQIGEVNHFFDRICVAVIDLTDTLRVGDVVHITGHSTDLQQEVISMQIDHMPIEEAGSGQEIALQVNKQVRRRDKVFKVFGEEE